MLQPWTSYEKDKIKVTNRKQKFVEDKCNDVNQLFNRRNGFRIKIYFEVFDKITQELLKKKEIIHNYQWSLWFNFLSSNIY